MKIIKKSYGTLWTVLIFIAVHCSKTPSPENMIAVVPTQAIEAGGIEFPMWTADSETVSIDYPFEISQTEMTYKLWKKVYNWANQDGGDCIPDIGHFCYTFTYKGREGSEGKAGAEPNEEKNQPVVSISWRDAIIWCNAYTEWYNATQTNKEQILVPVYKSQDGKILRSSKQAIESKWGADFKASENGFRLPTNEEWELAARFQGKWDKGNSISKVSHDVTYYFTKGNSASAAKKDYTDLEETNQVSWNETNSCYDGTDCDKQSKEESKKLKSHDVAGKKANALKLYDMSGNVSEWCFAYSTYTPKHSQKKRKAGCTRGGDYWHWGNEATDSSLQFLQVGKYGTLVQKQQTIFGQWIDVSGLWLATRQVGFRVARTVK